MVKIIDGEIVQDDDPRLTAPRRTAASGGQSGAAAAGGAGGAPGGATPTARSVFDFSKPPLRLIVDEDGAALAGLPSAVVFGARVRPQHLLMLAAAGLFIGWRGLLVGSILWYVWMANGGGEPQQQPPADQQRRMAAAHGYFEQMLGQAPLGRGGTAAAGEGGASSGAGPASRQTKDPWANKGKAYKLTD